MEAGTTPAADLAQLSINTIRTLSIDAVQQARSGHPGTPMGMAPVIYTLWQNVLRFDPEDPIWPNRDRFVPSAGHASMLLYSMLHLTGVKAVNPKYEVLGDAFRHEELGIFRPAVRALGQANFFDAERLAVCRRRVLAVGRAVTDVAVHDDEAGSRAPPAEAPQRAPDFLQVVCVLHVPHRPAVTAEALLHVLGERQRRVAFDRDVVPVVDPAEVAQLQMGRERSRLPRHAFH